MAISVVEFSRKDLKKLSSQTLRKVRAGMERDGALPLLRKARAEVMRRHDSGELRERALVRDIGGRYAAVLPFEGAFLAPAFYANPALLEIVAAMLGTNHCIGSLETVIAEPGAGRQHQHIDGPLRFDRIVGGKKRGFQGDLSGLPPFAVTLCVPLCDVNEENGPTAIWRGSHRGRPRIPGGAHGRELRTLVPVRLPRLPWRDAEPRARAAPGSHVRVHAFLVPRSEPDRGRPERGHFGGELQANSREK
jgi:hypothetical protein